MSKRSENVDNLFDYATRKPAGFTKGDACADLRLKADEFNRAVNDIRRIFAKDSITLVCVPAGQRQQWTYQLVGAYEVGGIWVDNRMADARTRFKTVAAITATLVNATDGRSRQGRIAREMNLTAKQLIERLELIDEVAS